jgi:hypothetical protein
MIKFSKICATALAMAMTVTLVAPVTAFAKVETTETLHLVKDLPGDDDELIDSNTVKIGTITGNGATIGAARSDAEAKLVAALKEKGFATTEKPYDDAPSITTADGTKYYVSYNVEDRDYDEIAANTWAYWYIGVTATVYTNRATGKSSVFRDLVDSNFTNDENVSRQFQKAIRIKKDEITYLSVALTGGDTTIKNIKSSKKKIATAKLYKKMGTETNTNQDVASILGETDPTTGKTTWTVSYYTTVGAKIIVGTYDNYDAAEAARKAVNTDASSAVRYIALTPKKTGKTNLSFDIVNKNGNVSKVKTTVYVVSDTDVFKTFTYGGKSLLDDYSNPKNINYGKRENDTLWDVATKKKGKLVVKTNANYKIKSIEIGKLYTEKWSEGLTGTDRYGNTYDRTDNYSAYSNSGTTTTHRVDLNGDGDFDDTVNGISESNVRYKYTKVKSGKTIKLSTVGTDYDSSFSYTMKDSKNSKDELINYSSNTKDRNLYAPTKVRVTVYDKLTKTYSVITKEIYVAVKK